MAARTQQPAAQARMITASSVVTNLVVRAAGLVPARLDLVHVGTPEQQLGLTLGGILIYLRTCRRRVHGGDAG